MIPIVPVCSVTVPANASAKSDEEPLKAPLVTSNVIAPVVPAFIAFNSVTEGASVIVTVPVCSVIVPEKAAAKSGNKVDDQLVAALEKALLGS